MDIFLWVLINSDSSASAFYIVLMTCAETAPQRMLPEMIVSKATPSRAFPLRLHAQQSQVGIAGFHWIGWHGSRREWIRKRRHIGGTDVIVVGRCRSLANNRI